MEGPRMETNTSAFHCCFETGSCSAAQAGLMLVILLSQSPGLADKHTPLYAASVGSACSLLYFESDVRLPEKTQRPNKHIPFPWLALRHYPSTVCWDSHLLPCARPGVSCVLQSVILCYHHRDAAEPSRVAEEYWKT